jgi:hypothetical protein
VGTFQITRRHRRIFDSAFSTSFSNLRWQGDLNMINHVVLMKFKPDVNDDAIDALEKSLDDLPNKIVEIQTYEFGRDRLHSEKSYDFAPVSLFANLEAVKRYQEHPAHLKVLQKIKTLSENIIVVDFEGTDAGNIKKDEEGAILSRLGRA